MLFHWRTRVVTLDLLLRLADAVEVSIAELVGESQRNDRRVVAGPAQGNGVLSSDA
jgi:hypothetical protein